MPKVLFLCLCLCVCVCVCVCVCRNHVNLTILGELAKRLQQSLFIQIKTIKKNNKGHDQKCYIGDHDICF
uniref:Secreted protein n=1 Tax=Octopus bimaculoides TaxID=37653 RepID=A0A0L8GVY7_OCTBM